MFRVKLSRLDTVHMYAQSTCADIITDIDNNVIRITAPN